MGCISCAKVTSDKSDEIYCKECATNIQLPYLDLYSTTKSPGLSDYDKDKWLYMDLTES